MAMPFTYTDPVTVPRDAVRLFIGDTNPAKPLFYDPEIAWFLQQRGNRPLQAAILACESLATRFSNQVDVTLGKLSLANSQRAASYRTRAQELRLHVGGGLGGGRLMVTGTSYAERLTQRQNRDVIQPVTEVGGSDYGEDGLGSMSDLVSRWA